MAFLPRLCNGSGSVPELFPVSYEGRPNSESLRREWRFGTDAIERGTGPNEQVSVADGVGRIEDALVRFRGDAVHGEQLVLGP